MHGYDVPPMEQADVRSRLEVAIGDGPALLVANQGSGSIVVFRIDQKTGELKMVDAPVEVPAPVCVKFLARS